MIKMIESFKYAVLGIIYCIKTQRNMRIHCIAALFVLILGYFLKITKSEWVMLAITITLVIVSEMMNTAIEATVDLYTETYHPIAKIAKDVAAGAVLITAVNALVVGLIIFYKYLGKGLELLK